MKPLALLCAAAVVAGGCSRREITVHGSLGEGWRDQRLFVSVDGQSGRVEVDGDTFALSGIPFGPILLRISSEDAEIARMEVRDVPAGATISFDRIRRGRGDDRAFPSAVRIEGADRVTVNGIRMADPDAFPRRVEAEGVVLALGDDEDAILVRPGDETLPDLPVVVTDSTQVFDAAGNEASLRRLSRGDSVRVTGRTASGYLFAQRISLAGAPAAVSVPSGGNGQSPDDGERGSDGEREAADEPRDARRRGSARERQQVPQGHRPPPGECRDWDPNLPAGQQPPPRKC